MVFCQLRDEIFAEAFGYIFAMKNVCSDRMTAIAFLIFHENQDAKTPATTQAFFFLFRFDLKFIGITAYDGIR